MQEGTASLEKMEIQQVNTQTLNPAGYSIVLECKHNLLRQAILNHQSRPKVLGLKAPARMAPEVKSFSSDQMVQFFRVGYKTTLLGGAFTFVALVVDALTKLG
jgi:hypothetical protein